MYRCLRFKSHRIYQKNKKNDSQQSSIAFEDEINSYKIDLRLVRPKSKREGDWLNKFERERESKKIRWGWLLPICRRINIIYPYFVSYFMLHQLKYTTYQIVFDFLFFQSSIVFEDEINPYKIDLRLVRPESKREGDWLKKFERERESKKIRWGWRLPICRRINIIYPYFVSAPPTEIYHMLNCL